MADHHDRPIPFPVPHPSSAPDTSHTAAAGEEAKPAQQPLRVILPDDPPALTPAAAAVLLRILRSAERRQVHRPLTTDPDRNDETDAERKAA